MEALLRAAHHARGARLFGLRRPQMRPCGTLAAAAGGLASWPCIPAARRVSGLVASAVTRRLHSTLPSTPPVPSVAAASTASAVTTAALGGAVDPSAHPPHKIWTVPNAMTTLRMLLAPVIAYDIVSGNYATAAGVFAFAGALDWADGWVARKFKGQSSLLGTFLDPIADKVLVACVGGALGWTGLLHPALIGLFVGRDLLLVGGAFYLRAKTRPQGQAFFALSEANTKIEPTQLSKVNTALQLGVVVASLAQAAWGVPPPAAVSALCWITAGTTIWSGVDYALNSGMKVGASAAAARARVQALKATVSERVQSMRARADSGRTAPLPKEADADKATTPAPEPADGVWEVAPAGGRAAALRPMVHIMRAVHKRSVADIASVTGLDAAVVRLLLGLGARAV